MLPPKTVCGIMIAADTVSAPRIFAVVVMARPPFVTWDEGAARSRSDPAARAGALLPQRLCLLRCLLLLDLPGPGASGRAPDRNPAGPHGLRNLPLQFEREKAIHQACA